MTLFCGEILETVELMIYPKNNKLGHFYPHSACCYYYCYYCCCWGFPSWPPIALPASHLSTTAHPLQDPGSFCWEWKFTWNPGAQGKQKIQSIWQSTNSVCSKRLFKVSRFSFDYLTKLTQMAQCCFCGHQSGNLALKKSAIILISTKLNEYFILSSFHTHF